MPVYVILGHLLPFFRLQLVTYWVQMVNGDVRRLAVLTRHVTPPIHEKASEVRNLGSTLQTCAVSAISCEKVRTERRPLTSDVLVSTSRTLGMGGETRQGPFPVLKH